MKKASSGRNLDANLEMTPIGNVVSYLFVQALHMPRSNNVSGICVKDRVVDTYRRSRTRMRERTRHRSGNTRSRIANGVTRHKRH